MLSLNQGFYGTVTVRYLNVVYFIISVLPIIPVELTRIPLLACSLPTAMTFEGRVKISTVSPSIANVCEYGGLTPIAETVTMSGSGRTTPGRTCKTRTEQINRVKQQGLNCGKD